MPDRPADFRKAEQHKHDDDCSGCRKQEAVADIRCEIDLERFDDHGRENDIYGEHCQHFTVGAFQMTGFYDDKPQQHDQKQR